MDDLIARANKYARSSGRTGQGQYRAAEKDERLGRVLSWTSTILTAIVGTSIFAQWVQNYPIPLGLAAIVAAALTAVHSTSKLEQRAEVHRTAGAEYGRRRRRADMLRLRLQGGDLSRAEGLAELDQIGEDLSELAGTTRALPDRIYEPAAEAFEASHPEYAATEPTHAGGVVVREGDGRYLVVKSADADGGEWALPTAKIAPGESEEQAVRRYLLREAGVDTAVRDRLDTIALPPNGRSKATFYLSELVNEQATTGARAHQWLTFEQAMEQVALPEFRRLLCHAHARSWHRAKTLATTPSHATV